MTITSLLIFFGILFGLVVIHELGHFLFAKYFKMRVDEFAFGFPPGLLRKKIGETVYSFNLIPLGGYVKIFGENGLDEEELAKLVPHEKAQLFGHKPWWQRILVLCGGVMFNILAAVILFSIAFMYGSYVYLEEDEINSVPVEARQMILLDLNEKSPLRGTGVELGDKIIRIESDSESLSGETLNSFAAAKFVQEHNNSLITIYFVNKEGYTNQAQVVPQAGIVVDKKVLGARFIDSTYKKYGLIDAIPQATKTTFEQLKLIFVGLYQLVHDLIFKDAKVEDNLAGPIGLAVMTSKVSEKGIDQIIIFAAMLSLSLAAFNILPIPALDGGRVLFVLAEFIVKRKIKASTEQIFHGLGFLALLALMVFVSYFDIVRAFN